MTQIPIFITSRKAHLREAKLWAERIPCYVGTDKNKAAKLVIKHLLGAIKAGNSNDKEK